MRQDAVTQVGEAVAGTGLAAGIGFARRACADLLAQFARLTGISQAHSKRSSATRTTLGAVREPFALPGPRRNGDIMRGKLVLLVGVGIGYVLGARAGRERYEDIKVWARNLWNDPRVQHQVHEAEEFAKDKAPDVARVLSAGRQEGRLALQAQPGRHEFHRDAGPARAPAPRPAEPPPMRPPLKHMIDQEPQARGPRARSFR